MTVSENADLLAEGLWQRLRDILLAQSRWDGFVNDPEGGDPQPLPIGRDDRLATEMTLRALRAGVDAVNHVILRRLMQDEEVTITALMEQTGLSRVGVTETVQDLAQVGLASYAPDSRQVRATAGAKGLLGLIDEIALGVRRLAAASGENAAPR